ncbi:hypothetical protein MAMC_02095 [Methylacidimicrobium cyclopophantes]|uniref:Uncharacterized protein n=1 Tax=Methylacidimicrobium cyclopophantes TaxID=1041766 RepID=A0A5E6MFX3_9BACT|nr:hypothetical protein MAMC_02095 [Methylacidimicrobium cyclopophantes]
MLLRDVGSAVRGEPFLEHVCVNQGKINRGQCTDKRSGQCESDGSKAPCRIGACIVSTLLFRSRLRALFCLVRLFPRPGRGPHRVWRGLLLRGTGRSSGVARHGAAASGAGGRFLGRLCRTRIFGLFRRRRRALRRRGLRDRTGLRWRGGRRGIGVWRNRPVGGWRRWRRRRGLGGRSGMAPGLLRTSGRRTWRRPRHCLARGAGRHPVAEVLGRRLAGGGRGCLVHGTGRVKEGGEGPLGRRRRLWICSLLCWGNGCVLLQKEWGGPAGGICGGGVFGSRLRGGVLRIARLGGCLCF